ncbi:MAG TPA: class I SAM-dependent methyltransferase [Nevskiaceae bacterium]|nr:class I SAM-dependent methyltransferase [Nevskiaceae bacterium]
MKEWDRLMDGIDAPPAVQMRSYWSDEGANLPPQYDLAVALAAACLIGEPNRLLDLGCNSGQPTIDALGRAGLANIHVEGYDVLPEEVATYFLPPDASRPNFVFTQLDKDEMRLPLEDKSMDIVLALNVLFRADNALTMLQEVCRVLREGGVAAISSNSRLHAATRHWIARHALMEVSQKYRISTVGLPVPANGIFSNDLPELLEKVTGFEIVAEESQVGSTVIDDERIDSFFDTIMLEAARTDLPKKYYSNFREEVRNIGTRLQARAKEKGYDLRDRVDRKIIIVRKRSETR